MTPEQLNHARHVNTHAADVVADYVARRATVSVDAALSATADDWRVDAVGLANYLRSRVPADAEALRAHAPFLWLRADECNLV